MTLYRSLTSWPQRSAEILGALFFVVFSDDSGDVDGSDTVGGDGFEGGSGSDDVNSYGNNDGGNVDDAPYWCCSDNIVS